MPPSYSIPLTLVLVKPTEPLKFQGTLDDMLALTVKGADERARANQKKKAAKKKGPKTRTRKKPG